MTAHPLPQVHVHCVCLLTAAGEGVSYSCSWKGVLAMLGSQAPPPPCKGVREGSGVM